jgi:hypothetical protein
MPSVLARPTGFPLRLRSRSQSRFLHRVAPCPSGECADADASEIASNRVPSSADVRIPVKPHRVLLWRLHGATNDLACAAVETSYGHALCLELGGEPILLELQRGLETLTAKADRLEATLLPRGWEIASA